LWPRADLARPTLAEGLGRAGATVVAPVTYRTVPVPPAALEPFARAVAENRLAAVAFCSPSSARYLARGLAWPDLSPLSGRMVVASIGSTTTAALEDLCVPPDVQARYPSADSLAAALADSLLARTSETA
jgi:uroporphyrinogen-III synthase